MKRLTAEKARELIAAWELNQATHGLSINGEYCLQAMHIALSVMDDSLQVTSLGYPGQADELIVVEQSK